MTQTQTDVTIIGAGPVGLFAIFECGMLGLRCHVIDALDRVGGQCAALYPEKPIYDIAGFPQILAGTLVEQLEKQAAPFKPTYHLKQKVTTLQHAPGQDGWHIETDGGVQLLTKTVIIAAGVGAFGPNRPPLPGIEDYEGTGVFYMVRKKDDFRGKSVVIAGGGDSAVDWALELVHIADRVAVVHRRNKFRAAPESELRLMTLAGQNRVDLYVPYQLSGLQGQNGQLRGVEVESLSGEKKVISADVLLPFYGLSMNLGPIKTWGLSLDNSNIAVSQKDCSTNQAGIYAIGDVASYPGKLKLILTGFAEAAHAAHAIRKRLYPDEVMHFEYSTTKGVPGVGA